MQQEKNISFQVLNNDANITNQDILLYEDHYVILGNNTNDNIIKYIRSNVYFK